MPRTDADISSATPLPRIAALATFRSAGYRCLWSASVLWNQARWMDQVVLSWVVLELTNSAWNVALVGVVRSLPIFLFGVLGGAVADRFDRRRLLMTAQAGGALVSLALFALLALDALRLEHALLAAFLLGIQWAIDWPARRALIPDLVGRDLVMNAVVLESVSMNFTRVLGPLIAGWMIAFVSPAASYLLMAALYGLEIVLLAVMPLHVKHERTATGSVLRYLREGFAELRASQPIVGVLLVTIFMNMLAFPYMQILAVFARDVLAVDAVGLGTLGAASGIGSLAGALILATRGHVPHAGMLFTLGSFVMSSFLVAFALTSSFELAVAFLVVSGFASAAFSAFQSTIILRSASDQLRGRAMGALTLAIGTAPLGLLEIGALSELIGPQFALAANAALCAVLVVAIYLWLPGFRRAD